MKPRIAPIARKYRFDELSPELERQRWQALPLEERLRAVVEMAYFWARQQGQTVTSGKIAPVARKRPLR
jgi:hypothetical protein